LSSAAAIQAGKLTRKVLVIDRKSRLGGVSVYTGTIPSKTLRETVLNPTGWRDRSFAVTYVASKMQFQPKI
jgi:NAD(P) transhydrogenase